MPYIHGRPHQRNATPDKRYIVRTCRGIKLGPSRTIKEGEEFPADAVPPRTLRLLYEQRQIDLMPPDGPAVQPAQAQAKG